MPDVVWNVPFVEQWLKFLIEVRFGVCDLLRSLLQLVFKLGKFDFFVDPMTPEERCLFLFLLLSLASLLGLIIVIVIVGVRPKVAVDHLFNDVDLVNFVSWLAKMTSFLKLALLSLPFNPLNVILAPVIVRKQGCVLRLKRST